MARPALRIDVTTKDRKELGKLLSGGVQQVRVVLRAVALSQLAQGVSAPRISSVTSGTALPSTILPNRAVGSIRRRSKSESSHGNAWAPDDSQIFRHCAAKPRHG